MAAFGLLATYFLLGNDRLSVLPMFETLNSFIRTSAPRTFSLFLLNEEYKDLDAFYELGIPLEYITNCSLYSDRKFDETIWEPLSLIIILSPHLVVSNILNSCQYDHNSVILAVVYEEKAVKYRSEELWRNNIISGYILLVTMSNASLYTYRPCAKHNVDVFLTSDMVRVDVFDMNRARMNVSVVNIQPAVSLIPNDDSKVEGVEGRIAVELTKKFNCEPHFNSARDGELWGWAQPKPAGVVGELYTGYSAIGVGMIAMADVQFKYIDQIAGFLPCECVSWAVPQGAGRTIVPWLDLLLSEFSIYTWITIAISFVYAILASLWVDGDGLGETVIRIFGSSIGIPVTIREGLKTNLLIMTWLWASFLLGNFYKSSMGSKLAVPPKESNIVTFHDLLGSTLNIMSIADTIELVRSEESIVKAIIDRTTSTTMTIPEAFSRIKNKKDLAYMRPLTYFRYEAYTNLPSFHGVHLMTDCALSFFSTISLEKRSPFFRGTYDIVSALFENGIILHWSNELMPVLPHPHESTDPLELGQTLGAFVILLVGQIVSVAIFIINYLRVRKYGRRTGFRKKLKCKKKNFMLDFVN